MPAQRLEITYIALDRLRPYANNPRLNEAAVPAVAESMLNFGFRVPIVVDGNMEIIAGHTRVLAAQRIVAEHPDRAGEFEEVPVLIATDLSADQIKAFRLVDNKTAELATWDMDLLANEIGALVDAGIPLTGYGWTQEEIDCLHSVVALDCLTNAEAASAAAEQAAIEGGKPKTVREMRHDARGVTKDGMSVRVSFGELGFYILLEDYEAWYDRLRKDTNFDLDAAVTEVATRVGLLEAKQKRDALISRGAATEAGQEAFEQPPVEATQEGARVQAAA